MKDPSEPPPSSEPEEDEAGFAPVPEDEPAARRPGQGVPPHRIALRALIGGPLGGVGAGVLAMLLIMLQERHLPSARELVFVTAIVCATCSMWCGLQALCREVADHFEPPLRYLAPVGIALGLLLAVAGVGFWAVALIEGRGMDWALSEFMRFVGKLGGTARDRRATVVVTLVLGLPFVGLASRSLLERAGRKTRSLGAHLLIAFGTGMASMLVLWVGLDPGPSRNEFGMIFTLFAVVPVAGAAGLYFTVPAEERLNAWWRARRDD